MSAAFAQAARDLVQILAFGGPVARLDLWQDKRLPRIRHCAPGTTRDQRLLETNVGAERPSRLIKR